MSALGEAQPQGSVADLLLVAATLGARVARGDMPDPGQIARAVLDIALALVPEEDLRAHLSAAAVARAERVYQAAEAAKYGEREDP